MKSTQTFHRMLLPLLILAVASLGTAFGQPVTVGPGGSYNHETIQDAIDAAADGDVIHVYPGTYIESASYGPGNTNTGNNPVGLLINKSVTILGVDGDGDPIADVDDIEATVISSKQSNWGTNFHVTAPGVKIQGLELQGTTTNPGDPTVNKVIEVLKDGFELRHSKVGPVDGKTLASAVYINDENVPANVDLDTFVSDIGSYHLHGNVLNGQITISNGVGFGIAGTEYEISNNQFLKSHNVRALTLQGKIDGVAWLNAPVTAPDIVTDNVFSGELTQVIRHIESDPADIAIDEDYIRELVANNTVEGAAWVLEDGALKLNFRDFGTYHFREAVAYTQVQPAIDAADEGDAVRVAAGTYEETLSIGKPLTLLGPNDGKAGYAEDREDEAVIQYPSGITSGFNILVAVDSDDVAIRGFTFNDNLTVGLTYNGTWPLPLSARGIRSWGSNTVVENNRFSGFNNIAVHMTQDGAASQPHTAATTGNFTGYNLFEGAAIFTPVYYQAAGGNIIHNKLVGVAGGIQVQPYRTDASGVVSDNQISTYASGLYYNYANGSQIGVSEWSFTNNSITAPTVPPVWNKLIWHGASVAFEGIRVETYIETPGTFAPKAHFENNAINGSGASTPEYFNVRGVFFRNVNGNTTENIQNITFTDNNFLNVEQGVLLSAVTTVNYELEPLWTNGNTYPDGMLVVPPNVIGFAPVVNVTQGLGYSTIQAAIDAAEAGHTIEIGPGTYEESVTIDKSLHLIGSGPGVTTWRGTAITDRSLLITRDSAAPADVHVEVTGFSFETEKNQTIRASWNTTFAEALTLDIHGNRFQHVNTRNPGSDFALYVSGANQTPRAAQGALRVHDNEFDVVTGGVLFEYCRAVDVVNNTFNVTYEGVAFNYYGNNGTLGEQLVSGNTFTHVPVDWAFAMNNWHGAGDYTVLPGVVEENIITDTGFAYSILYGVAAEDRAPADFTIYRNVIKSGSITVWGDFASQANLTATHNYWGDPTGPTTGANPIGQGVPIPPSGVAFSPWYADEALTILVTLANFEPLNIGSGQEEIIDEGVPFYIGGNAKVEGTLIIKDELVLGPNGVLEVTNGSLVLSDGSVLEGTFSFFNSLGSVEFNGDVNITGSATGLILISDVHVADAVTVTVDGTLVIDGCVVDSTGRFKLVVGEDARFTMARTVFVNGDIEVESGDTAIYDNRFQNSTIEVLTGTTGARIFHNITDDLGWLTDDGTDTVTSVDNWGNVTDAGDTENNLALGLDISDLTDGQTQDLDGNVFIQPGDSVFATINVSDLQANIAAVEVLLGYNTTLIDVATLGLADDWDVLINSVADDSNAIGLLDAAIGLSFDFGDPLGTSADQEIGDVELEAGTDEGETLFFHRVKLSTDTFGGETRLTTGGPSPAFLTPFTSNSAMITIDGTDPLIADPADYAMIEQFGDDVNTDTTPAAVTIQGVVDITASAFDALAGIEDAKAVVALVGPDTYTATQTGTLAGPSIGGDDYTTYTFTYAVDSTTLNGTYDVVFTVTDRSGNQTVETLGTIEINKNQVEVEIELQGLVAGPITRDVEFVFTDSLGAEIETRIEPVEFTGGVGSVTFTDVDGDTFRLSAKTAWNLRKRLEVGLDANGQASVDFTGANLLRGGDLNNLNVVNTLDYSILRFYWQSTTDATADITGDGVVNLTDFNILQANFYQAGDPK